MSLSRISGESLDSGRSAVTTGGGDRYDSGVMRWLLPLLVLAGLAILAVRAPQMALILSGVAVAALLVGRAREKAAGPRAEDLPEDTSPTGSLEVAVEPEPPEVDPRVLAAFKVGRREAGLPETEDDEDIALHSAEGFPIHLRVGYRSDIPYIALRTLVSDDTEMAFIVRRKRSPLGLPKVVDNTPIDTARFEYRLRPMPVHPEVDAYYEAASNRPRLFRQLVEAGLGEELERLIHHPLHRLADLVYGGNAVTMLLQPAADPSLVPYVHASIEVVEPLVDRLRTFLEEATIPSAQS